VKDGNAGRGSRDCVTNSALPLLEIGVDSSLTGWYCRG